MEGAAPIWFCKREGCPLLLVAEGKKKIKGSGARRRAVRVCVGLWGSWTTVERKKEREGCLQEKPGRKAYFVPTLSSSFANPLSMKIDPIYRAGQRVISSSMGTTSQPLIRLE